MNGESRQPSPVVVAKACLSGFPDFTNVQVWFKSHQELQTLIDGLVALRDSEGKQADHLHLQHRDMRPGALDGKMEITFYRPGALPTELDQELIDESTRNLEIAKSMLKDEMP